MQYSRLLNNLIYLFSFVYTLQHLSNHILKSFLISCDICSVFPNHLCVFNFGCFFLRQNKEGQYKLPLENLCNMMSITCMLSQYVVFFVLCIFMYDILTLNQFINLICSLMIFFEELGLFLIICHFVIFRSCIFFLMSVETVHVTL